MASVYEQFIISKGLSHSLTTERREHLKSAQHTKLQKDSGEQMNLLPTI